MTEGRRGFTRGARRGSGRGRRAGPTYTTAGIGLKRGDHTTLPTMGVSGPQVAVGWGWSR